MRYLSGCDHFTSVNDTTDLCVLGVLFDDARTINSLVSAVRILDTAQWTPTREVLEFSIKRLLETGALVNLASGNEIYYSITGKGIKRYFTLMKLPLGAYSLNTQSTLALKSAFLENVPSTVRTQTVRELISYYACKLTCLEQNCDSCLQNSGRQKLNHNMQIQQIKTELDWLQTMT
ncbi:MAG: hypothetical protein HWE30_14165 [Methylocystaceae bacterium]|nr:hypothetical protein [Methylocystaceae bacterium]